MITTQNKIRGTALAILYACLLALVPAQWAEAANGTYTTAFCANPETGTGVSSTDGVAPAGFVSNVQHAIGFDPADAKCGPTAMSAARGITLKPYVPFTTTTPGDGVGALSFTTPAGLALQNVALYRSVDMQRADNHMTYAVHSGQWNAVFDIPRGEVCEWPACTSLGNPTNPWAASNFVAFPSPSPAGFHVTLSCSIPDSSWTCSAAGDVYVRIYGGKLMLRDETNPEVSGTPSGGLMTEPVVRGVQDVTVNATDTGSGVYRVQLVVDGVPTMWRTVDENAGKCIDVNAANSDAYEFAAPVPCRLSAGGTYAFDTRQLPEGTHNLKILLEDASGNSATLSNRNVVVDNVADVAGESGAGNGANNGTNPGPVVFDRGPANGTNASDDARLTALWVKHRGTVLRSRYGTRQVIRGRLVNGKGKGIGNARIELAATPSAKGAVERLDKGGARTRPDGSYTIILPKDVSSRTLTLRYRSHQNDAAPAASRTLRLKVTAGVRLAVAPRVAARGKTIRLVGRLQGAPLPPAGKVLELQARTPGGGWVTFSTVRTNRSGAFTAKYTFRRGGPVTYELRVRSRASGDYAYELGTSRAVSVRVR